MYRLSGLFFFAISVFSAASVAAQRKPAPTESKQHKLIIPQAYLGDSDYRGGVIGKEEFARLMKKGLHARDSSGKRYKVTGFEFIYGERQLYEDSAGRSFVMFDYLSEYCPGDTLSPGVAASLYERLKAGDTAYFNRIEVMRIKPGEASGTVIMGKGMKFGLTR